MHKRKQQINFTSISISKIQQYLFAILLFVINAVFIAQYMFVAQNRFVETEIVQAHLELVSILVLFGLFV